MPSTQQTNEEISQIGEEIYRRQIRDRVMPQDKGKFVIIDVQSGDYEVHEDDLKAEEALRHRRSQGVFYGKRIGYQAAYTLAGTMVEEDT